MSTITLKKEIANCIRSMHPEFHHNEQVAEKILKVLERRIDENITEPYCKSRFKEMLKE